ncbi:hypothetical protein Q7X34_004254 [Salmonella enterica subsp. enterica]|nr:hypothetical protein [Salmonella enterica subsp. enterica]
MSWSDFFGWANILLKLILPGAVTGLIVTWITARYAIKRLYEEKWWEKKLAAFTEATNHVYTVKRIQEYWQAAAAAQEYQDYEFKKLSKEEEDALRVEYVAAFNEITRISHLASLTLTEAAGKLLTNYVVAENAIFPAWWGDELTSHEATSRSTSLINALLPALLKEAQVALKANKKSVKKPEA